MQVMLLRNADNRNLTMAFPNGINFKVPNIFKATYVVKYKVNETFDFITHHLRFNQAEVRWPFITFKSEQMHTHDYHSETILYFAFCQWL